jgi:hypothetical protein
MRKAWLVLITMVVACGSDGVAIGDFAAEYEAATCKYSVRCESQPDAATCKESTDFDTDGTFLSLVDAVEKGTVAYDEEAAADCIAEAADASCMFVGFANDDSACSDVFRGTVPQGGACDISFECADYAACEPTDPNCDPDQMCCPGTCGTPQTEVAAGGTCGDNTYCAAGTYCKPTGTDTGTCTARLTTEGAACDSLDACEGPMICDIFAMAPTCVKPAGDGETCDPEALIPCGDGRQHCDEMTLKCVDALPTGSPCETSSVCRNDATCSNGTCQPDGSVGDPCVTTGCLGDLECDANDTCQPEPAGMSCL